MPLLQASSSRLYRAVVTDRKSHFAPPLFLKATRVVRVNCRRLDSPIQARHSRCLGVETRTPSPATTFRSRQFVRPDFPTMADRFKIARTE